MEIIDIKGVKHVFQDPSIQEMEWVYDTKRRRYSVRLYTNEKPIDWVDIIVPKETFFSMFSVLRNKLIQKDSNAGPQIAELGHKEIADDVTAFGYILTYLDDDGKPSNVTYKICLEEDGSKYREREVFATTDFNEFVNKWSNLSSLS